MRLGPIDGVDPVSDYRLIKERIPHFDYYLYTGLDEGSLGTLDALAAGVKTIVTSQGFHVDLPYGITHPFWDYKELLGIFEEIQKDRELRINSVKNLSWRTYANRHVLIWKTMLEGRTGELPRLLGQVSLEPLGGNFANQEKHLASERRRLWLRSLRRYRIPRLRSRISTWLRNYLPSPMKRRLFRN